MPELETKLPDIDKLLAPYLGDVKNLASVRSTLIAHPAQAMRFTTAGTGPQASMKARVQSTVDAVRPLLAALKPLKKDCCDAGPARQRVSDAFDELAAAFQTRHLVWQRVDGVFEQLTGRTKRRSLLHPRAVKGHLGKLRDAFGLGRDDCGAAAAYAEQLTTFRLIVEYADALRLSWYALRDDPDGDAGEAIGTAIETMQLLGVSLNESLQQFQSAMREAGITAADQRTTVIDADEPVVLADLIDWLGDFAGRQVMDAEDIASTLTTLERLYRLVKALAADPDGDEPEKPALRGLSLKRFEKRGKPARAAAACCDEDDEPAPLEIDQQEIALPEAFYGAGVCRATSNIRRILGHLIAVAQQVTLQPAAILTNACFSLAAGDQQYTVHMLHPAKRPVRVRIQGANLEDVVAAYLAPSHAMFEAKKSIPIDIDKPSAECITGMFTPEAAPGPWDVVVREASGALAFLRDAIDIEPLEYLKLWLEY